uniref:Large ribosomal subunit protein uL6 n=1 Tax=uncultured korarchaeote TaxID=161241 RepID=A0A1L2JM47_9CREN|nr:ribosomal protein L6P/L9E [uncultured korarchaeote]
MPTATKGTILDTSLVDLVKLEIPKGVEVEVHEDHIIVNGPLGSLRRKYDPRLVKVLKVDSELIIFTDKVRKKTSSLVKTMRSHVKNMIRGVTEGFQKKMIIAYSHFPMRVKIDEQKRLVIIENFLGERSPRVAKIVGEKTKIRVEGDYLYITGISPEEVGQTAANIRLATRIKRKDPRVFQDGIYVVEGE